MEFGPPKDNLQAGRRPVVILQSNPLNDLQGHSLLVVVPVTTNSSLSPTYLKLTATKESGLAATSYAKCHQIFTIPKAYVESKIGGFSSKGLDAISEAGKKALSLI